MSEIEKSNLPLAPAAFLMEKLPGAVHGGGAGRQGPVPGTFADAGLTPTRPP